MRHGTINCSCGQQFYFESANEGGYKTIGFDDDQQPMNKYSPPTIKCIKCKKDYDISKYPEKKEPIEEVGEEDGTDI